MPALLLLPLLLPLGPPLPLPFAVLGPLPLLALAPLWLVALLVGRPLAAAPRPKLRRVPLPRLRRRPFGARLARWLRRRRRRRRRHISRRLAAFLCRLLLRSGDIEQNPGPLREATHPDIDRALRVEEIVVGSLLAVHFRPPGSAAASTWLGVITSKKSRSICLDYVAQLDVAVDRWASFDGSSTPAALEGHLPPPPGFEVLDIRHIDRADPAVAHLVIPAIEPQRPNPSYAPPAPASSQVRTNHPYSAAPPPPVPATADFATSATVPPEIPDDMFVPVACVGRGSGSHAGDAAGMVAAAAAWFGPGDPRNNCCARLPGRQTLARAETLAAVLACTATDAPIMIRACPAVVGAALLPSRQPIARDLWAAIALRQAPTKWTQRQEDAATSAATALCTFASGGTTATLRATLIELYSRAPFLMDTTSATLAADIDAETASRCRHRPARLPPPPPGPPPPPEADTPPAFRRPTDGDLHPPDDNWLRMANPTIRLLHKREWESWSNLFIAAARGYSASDFAGRTTRLKAVLNLPRMHLSVDPSGAPSGEPPGAPETRPRKPPAQASIDGKRAETLVRLSAVGKAARTLAGPPSKSAVEQNFDEAIKQLADLHPSDRGVIIEPSTYARPINLTTKGVRRAVMKSLSRGAAPGLDGWTRELLVPLLANAEATAELTAIVQDLLMCNVDTQLAGRLRACPLTALNKEPTGIRPIAPESAFIKLASICALALLDSETRESFAPLQLGVFGDVEQAALKLREMYVTDGNMIAIDAVNAFNSVDRTAIFTELYKRKSTYPLWGIAALTLGTPSTLVVKNREGRCETLASVSGVRQGSVLGPILFSLALQPLLQASAAASPTVTHLAYLDDITLSSEDPDALAETFITLSKALGTIGLTVNMRKTFGLGYSTWARTGVSSFDKPVAKLLGAGIAADRDQPSDVLSEWCTSRLDTSWFDRITAATCNSKTKLMILSACGVPRATFLLRVHPPEVTSAGLQRFDDAVEQAVLSTVGLLGTPLSPTNQTLLRLPLCLGGLGFRRLAPLADVAHRACVDGQTKGQLRATAAFEVELHASLLSSISAADQAIVLSGAQPGAGRMLTDSQVVVGDAAFATWCRERLLLRVHAPGPCECGVEDAQNVHVNGCPAAAGARTIRHNNILQAIASTLERAGCTVRLEPRALNSDAPRRRPDLQIMATPLGPCNYVTDLTVRFPASVAALPASASTPLRAAGLGEAAKDATWQAWATAHGAHWAPLAFESTGALAPRGKKWLTDVCGQLDGPLTVRTVLDELLAECLGQLAQGNLEMYIAAEQLEPQSPRRRTAPPAPHLSPRGTCAGSSDVSGLSARLALSAAQEQDQRSRSDAHLNNLRM